MNFLQDAGFEDNTSSADLEKLQFPTIAANGNDGWFRMIYGDSPDIVDDNSALEPFNNLYSAVSGLTNSGNRALGLSANSSTTEGVSQFLTDGSGNAAFITGAAGTGTQLSFSVNAVALADDASLAGIVFEPDGDGSGNETVLNIYAHRNVSTTDRYGAPSGSIPGEGAGDSIVIGQITIPNNLGTSGGDVIYSNLSTTVTIPAGFTMEAIGLAIDTSSVGGAEEAVILDDLVLETAPVCFTPDSLITTAGGPKRIGDLQVGDEIQTKDHGLQPLRWMYSRKMNAAELVFNDRLAPVKIRKDALGKDQPNRDMLVSPGHMMLTSNRDALRKWELSEALVPANRLAGVVDGVEKVTPEDGVTYVHLMFEQHEVVEVDGTWSESFRPSFASLKMIGHEGQKELVEIFPELKVKEPESIFAAVRESFYTGRANQLARRVAKFGMH